MNTCMHLCADANAMVPSAVQVQQDCCSFMHIHPAVPVTSPAKLSLYGVICEFAKTQVHQLRQLFADGLCDSKLPSVSLLTMLLLSVVFTFHLCISCASVWFILAVSNNDCALALGD